MQQTVAERKIHWGWWDGTPVPGLEEMTNVNKVLPSFQRVLSGEHSTVREVNFRDPNMFVAGEVQNHLEACTVILQDYQDGGQFWGTSLGREGRVFKGIHYDSPSPHVFMSSVRAILPSMACELVQRSLWHSCGLEVFKKGGTLYKVEPSTFPGGASDALANISLDVPELYQRQNRLTRFTTAFGP